MAETSGFRCRERTAKKKEEEGGDSSSKFGAKKGELRFIYNGLASSFPRRAARGGDVFLASSI